MNDVTALVLTIGEPYTERALASLQRQTVRPVDTIVIEGISPFHRAFNTGAAAVRTEFFVQVVAARPATVSCRVRALHLCVSPVGTFAVSG